MLLLFRHALLFSRAAVLLCLRFAFRYAAAATFSSLCCRYFHTPPLRQRYYAMVTRCYAPPQVIAYFTLYAMLAICCRHDMPF